MSALLQNGADFDAVDSNGDNALHIAAREGHIAVARALLTESELNAEAINLKGKIILRTIKEKNQTINWRNNFQGVIPFTNYVDVEKKMQQPYVSYSLNAWRIIQSTRLIYK